MYQKYKVYVNGFGRARIRDMDTGEWYRVSGPFGGMVVAEYSSAAEAEDRASILSRRDCWVPAEEKENG